MRIAQFIFAGILAIFAAAAVAAPCAGFADVDDASTFCPSVEWIKNRGVTLGCRTGAYCPFESVTRLQMAAFMQRLGDALTPRVIVKTGTVNGAYLASGQRMCVTEDFDVAEFPRLATPSGIAVWENANTSLVLGQRVEVSTDQGLTWAPTPTAFATYATLSGDVTERQTLMAIEPGIDLIVGQRYRFSILAFHVSGGAATPAATCSLRVSITSRTSASSPR